MKKKIVVILISCFCMAMSASSLSLTKKQLLKDFEKSLNSDYSSLFQAINSSVVTPNAAGSTSRGLFVGVSYMKNWDQGYGELASLLTGISFGNAKKNIGATIAVISPITKDGKLSFKDHAFTLRLNRYLNNYFSVAIGANNTLGIGSFSKMAHSFFAVLTVQEESSFLPITASIGIGSAAYTSALQGLENNDKYYSAFYNLGLGLTEDWALMADYSAQSLSVGTSYIFKVTPKIPVVLTFSVLNVAGKLLKGQKRYNVSFTIAYAHPF